MAGERVDLPLGDVCRVKQGRYLGPGDMSEVKTEQTPIPVIGANGILGYTDQVSYLDPVTLVTCRGSNCGLLQRTSGPTWISNNAMACPPKPPHDSRYIHYVLQSTDFGDVITGSAQPQITTGHLNTKVVTVTRDPEEQRAIAHVLGTLDDLIELNRETNAILEEMARALFKSWFVNFDPVRAKLEGRQPAGMDAETAKLFPDHFQDSELGQIPMGWEVRSIGEVVDCVGGGTPSTSEPGYWENGTIHWTSPKDLSNLSFPFLIKTDRRITEAGLARISSGLLPAGTLLMSSRAPVGYLAIAEIPVAINQGYIAMKPNEIASNYYLLNWCHYNMAEIENRASGTTFAEISKSAFRQISLLLPSVDIMNTFTKCVEPFYAQIVSNLHESRDLATVRDTLLPKLLSGELSLYVTN